MKIVVFGGTGLIGRKLIALLERAGHAPVAASPSSGVDTIAGIGLDEVLAGADVSVDVTNSPSFAEDDVLAFFRTSTANQLAAAAKAGVGHHVALSIVGTDRVPDSGYLRAKAVQEELITSGPVPFTIVRATQFYEFAAGIAASATGPDGTVHLTPAKLQPVAADDVARVLAEVVPAPPVKGIVELGGPEKIGLDEFVRRAVDPSTIIVTDPAATYFGAHIDDTQLTTGPHAHIGAIGYADWLAARS
ncbi:SDR family oxidoreductase [Dactylosporangium matsuzakiense]|uniref:LysR family transcriptional regulator n=1 Tax=Dactylosporangium matsuzakiense TaxID=53360 RepID=A0A9W6KRZ9_9ACTN|nr:SDR family oxidoreductase [Dactylosporangium matsuzakiense]UWZ41476.1 SDR family oxidoreductase [Dactylosporangium matsuzakiense]GLL07037.1 LysR family transcriptional regulator [Dactylosporangium matsuzakiense]